MLYFHDNLIFRFMKMNFVGPQLFIKWFVCNALLHRPRQYKYLGYFWISFDSDNRILRYQRKYIVNKHKCSGARRREILLHLYYSSRQSLLYESLSSPLCVSTANLLLNHQIGMHKRHLEPIFHEIWKSIKSHSRGWTLLLPRRSQSDPFATPFCMNLDNTNI